MHFRGLWSLQARRTASLWSIFMWPLWCCVAFDVALTVASGGLLKDGWVVWVLKKSAGHLGFWPQSLRTLQFG